MRQYIQKIATGPELSKDLSREEARDGMGCILSGDADPVQAAIFLIALRMKRETMPENQGVLDALLEYTCQARTTVDDVLDLSDPFDGFTRGMPAAPFDRPPRLKPAGANQRSAVFSVLANVPRATTDGGTLTRTLLSESRISTQG